MVLIFTFRADSGGDSPRYTPHLQHRQRRKHTQNGDVYVQGQADVYSVLRSLNRGARLKMSMLRHVTQQELFDSHHFVDMLTQASNMKALEFAEGEPG